MRRPFGSTLVVAGLMLAPALAAAQHSMGAMPAHEFGADLTLYYGSYSLAGTSVSHFVIGTPVWASSPARPWWSSRACPSTMTARAI